MTTFQEDNWQHVVALPSAGVHFDGGATFNAADLLAPDSPVMSVSYWYRIFSDQSAATSWTTDVPSFAHTLEFWDSGNSPAVIASEPEPQGEDPGGFSFGSIEPAGLGVWHHVAWTCDTNAKTAVLMLDGAVVTDITNTFGESFSIGAGGRQFCLGGDGFGNNIEADYFDLWIAFGQAISLPAEIGKFRTAGGRPVPLGANGELPTGLRPTIFGHGGRNSFLQPNLGDGGGLSLSGVLSDATLTF